MVGLANTSGPTCHSYSFLGMGGVLSSWAQKRPSMQKIAQLSMIYFFCSKRVFNRKAGSASSKAIVEGLLCLDWFSHAVVITKGR